MYPLNLHNPSCCGFAVANDETEHRALSDMGYEPAFQASGQVADEVEALRAQLDALGIPYHHRAGADKLRSLLPKA
jgi:hypothetical protein